MITGPAGVMGGASRIKQVVLKSHEQRKATIGNPAAKGLLISL